MRSEQEIRADLERKGERDAAFRAKIEAGQCRHLLDATGESQFITSRLVADVPDLLHRAEAAESALAQLREQIAAGIEAELDARRTPPHLDGPHREGIFVGLNLAHRIITGVPDVTEDELHRYPTARLSAPSTVTPPETDERPARPQLHPNAVKERATVALDGTAGPSTPVDEPERPLILHDEHFPECADENARLRDELQRTRGTADMEHIRADRNVRHGRETEAELARLREVIDGVPGTDIGGRKDCGAVNPSNRAHCTLPPTRESHARPDGSLIHSGVYKGDVTRWSVQFVAPAAGPVLPVQTDDELHIYRERSRGAAVPAAPVEQAPPWWPSRSDVLRCPGPVPTGQDGEK